MTPEHDIIRFTCFDQELHWNPADGAVKPVSTSLESKLAGLTLLADLLRNCQQKHGGVHIPSKTVFEAFARGLNARPILLEVIPAAEEGELPEGSIS